MVLMVKHTPKIMNCEQDLYFCKMFLQDIIMDKRVKITLRFFLTWTYIKHAYQKISTHYFAFGSSFY